MKIEDLMGPHSALALATSMQDKFAMIDKARHQLDTMAHVEKARVEQFNAAGLALQRYNEVHSAKAAADELAKHSVAMKASLAAVIGTPINSDIALAFGIPKLPTSAFDIYRHHELFGRGEALALASRIASFRHEMTVLATGIQQSGLWDDVRSAALRFEAQFRSFNAVDWTSIELAKSGIAQAQLKLMSGITTPLINIAHSDRSLMALLNLASLGKAVGTYVPFGQAVTNRMRDSFGDWRDVSTSAHVIIEDPVARAASYEARGFRMELTDFPARGFDEALVALGFHAKAHVDPVLLPSSEDVADLNLEGYATMFLFEQLIRDFIEQRLSELDPRWARTRVDGKVYESWQQKRQREIDGGRPSKRLIDYAEFSDYSGIITRGDNWRDCFRHFFRRQEFVTELFNRLSPIRHMVAHMRFLTNEDILILSADVVHVRRMIIRTN